MPNRLKDEKSPYLLQHQHNPVDWYPWGDEAFAAARDDDKPIFLSIGYSTCHWCHVMEHESFEDDEVAALMNETFVSIKVDREERPDVDKIYMDVCQMMTGQGGWPLTVVMTPDRKPFFAGTYFPKTSRFGRIGMLDLVPRINKLWGSQRSDLIESAEQITGHLQESSHHEPGEAFDENILRKTNIQLFKSYERSYGGFGDAPKFPTPHNLLFLMRYYERTQDPEALKMVETTLHWMRLGGMYDHVGFGFHRYSTDKRWFLPHFEKMLYDQALIALAYLEAHQLTGNKTHADTAREIFEYIARDMTDPGGGFYAAEDADSEGEEGKFYVWSTAELREVLGDEADLLIEVWGAQEGGNFHEEATGQATGTNILHLERALPAIAQARDMSGKALRAKLDHARQTLFAVREERIHPLKDDKIMTDWNGLMIAALAKGATILGEPRYAEAADRAAAFALEALRRPDGRLLHRFREGKAELDAYADDYAFLVWGLIELYQATFEVRHLESALALNARFIEHYWDDEHGGFFFTADDAEKLLVRRKEIYDGAVPSGNSVAALNLLRLSHLTGDASFAERADRIFRCFAERADRLPIAHTQLMIAVDFALGPARELVIAGDPATDDTQAMLAALRGRYLPRTVVLQRNPQAPDIDSVSGWTANHGQVDGKAAAYLCRAFACDAPVTTVDEMIALLDS